MAQLAATGRLRPGDAFAHESIIGGPFEGRGEAAAGIIGRPAIVLSIVGWVRTTGHNTIFVDERDLYGRGFQVT